MKVGIIVVLIICIIVLVIKLTQKTVLDESRKNQLEQEVNNLEEELDSLENEIQIKQNSYHDLVNNKIKNLDNLLAKQEKQRQKDFEDKWFAKDATAAEQFANTETYYKQEAAQLEANLQQVQKDIDNKIEILQNNYNQEEEKFKALLGPLQQYDKEQQEKLFYTIQIPEEYHNDINFLLTDVAEKVQHPDIISKLVWAEYVKPYMDDTFKRVGIEDKPGIYKITNINTGKPYIGKSTNIKKRLQDHFKSAVGIQSIADQTVHHALLKEGLWNWSIEYIIYCDKDQLGELEKYYINFFKTQEFGYNRKDGG